MQTANIMLGIGGGRDNVVPKYNVTAAEIAVLRAIHGNDAVYDVEPCEPSQEVKRRNNRQELQRLHEIYGNSMDGNGNRVVGLLYPGAAARVFENLDELDLEEELFKPKSRETANSTPGDDGDTPIGKMNVDQLKAYAKDNGIDLAGATKKVDIVAAIELAEEGGQGGFDDDADEDGVGDLPPVGGSVLE